MTKQLTCLSIILLLSARAVQAQSTTFGVTGGFHAAWLRERFVGPADPTSRWRPCFQAGLFGHLPLTPRLGARAELLYWQSGDRYGSPNAAPYSFQGRTHLSYLALPVLAQREVRRHLSVLVGPQLGWLLRVRNQTRLQDPTGQLLQQTDRNITGFWRRVDVGVALGLAYQVTAHIGVATRYTLGVVDLAKASGASSYNRVGQCSVDYSF